MIHFEKFQGIASKDNPNCLVDQNCAVVAVKCVLSFFLKSKSNVSKRESHKKPWEEICNCTTTTEHCFSKSESEKKKNHVEEICVCTTTTLLPLDCFCVFGPSPLLLMHVFASPRLFPDDVQRSAANVPTGNPRGCHNAPAHVSPSRRTTFWGHREHGCTQNAGPAAMPQKDWMDPMSCGASTIVEMDASSVPFRWLELAKSLLHRLFVSSSSTNQTFAHPFL